MCVNFIDYVTRLRVEKARSLYMNTDMKIYEIAELVGYSDWHYLYSVYKKQLGHSMSKEKRRKNPSNGAFSSFLPSSPYNSGAVSLMDLTFEISISLTEKDN